MQVGNSKHFSGFIRWDIFPSLCDEMCIADQQLTRKAENRVQMSWTKNNRNTFQNRVKVTLVAHTLHRNSIKQNRRSCWFHFRSFFPCQATIYRQLTILVNELQWQIPLDNSFFTVFARFKSSDLTNRATPTRNSSLAMRLTFRSLSRFCFQLSIARRLMLWRAWPSVEVEMEAS